MHFRNYIWHEVYSYKNEYSESKENNGSVLKKVIETSLLYYNIGTKQDYSMQFKTDRLNQRTIYKEKKAIRKLIISSINIDMETYSLRHNKET